MSQDKTGPDLGEPLVGLADAPDPALSDYAPEDWAAFGAPPTVAIKSVTNQSDTITPGDIAVFEAAITPSVDAPADKPADVKARWFVEPELFADGKPTYLVLDAAAGKLPRLQIATRSGRLRVELVAVCGDEIGRVVKDVVIAGTIPTPSPQPQPQPQPTPQPNVDDKHGFVTLIRSKVVTVTIQRAAAAKIANIYRTAAAVAAAGAPNPTDPTVTQVVGLMLKATGVTSDLSHGVTIRTASDVVKQLVKAQITADEAAVWAPIMMAVEQRLPTEAKTLSDAAECLTEIATALAEVK